MDEPIKIGNGILEQIKPCYITVTKEYLMKLKDSFDKLILNS